MPTDTRLRAQNAGPIEHLSLWPGRLLRILPAYDHQTKRRDVHDRLSGCEGAFMRDDGDDILLDVVGIGEVWVSRTRVVLPK